jgi:transposase-like protein
LLHCFAPALNFRVPGEWWAFPSVEAALKVMYLALRNVIAKWERPLNWKAALNRFTLLWEDRIQIATKA